ncbi:MAG: non-canonical purine NTP pyrophosphatase, partial [Veillonella nakazawae]
VYPDGREVTAEGYCDGLVQDEPKGDNGFGYDPYFYVPEFEKTMAELSIEEKETISHRGRALRKLINKL